MPMDMPPNEKVEVRPHEAQEQQADIVLGAEHLDGGVEHRNNPNEEFITISISNSAFDEKTGKLAIAITKLDLDTHFDDPVLPRPNKIYLVRQDGSIIDVGDYSISNGLILIPDFNHDSNNLVNSIQIDNPDFDQDAADEESL